MTPKKCRLESLQEFLRRIFEYISTGIPGKNHASNLEGNPGKSSKEFQVQILVEIQQEPLQEWAIHKEFPREIPK